MTRNRQRGIAQHDFASYATEGLQIAAQNVTTIGTVLHSSMDRHRGSHTRGCVEPIRTTHGQSSKSSSLHYSGSGNILEKCGPTESAGGLSCSTRYGS